MKAAHKAISDANEAVARVAYLLSEVVAIYPITPSSPMAEQCDEWAAEWRPNVWGTVPTVVQLQSEGGVAGAVHGALQAGALSTTFTASQGLLLMIPNMYKIAGELTPFVLHVAARSLATQGLSIFGDHGDVMACRQTGFAMLAGASVQEAQDMALIAHAATLEARMPFLHFFDGFRTSHEINTYAQLPDDVIRSFISPETLTAFRNRALSPDRPAIRGTAQNPDVYFQAREAANPFVNATPATVLRLMEMFESLTGRRYRLFDYHGAPDATRVIIVMGSGAETCAETARYLNAQGEKVGVVNVHLYRPWSVADFAAALPGTVQSIAVLDRTKEPGALGEPLYLDVVAALVEARAEGLLPDGCNPTVIGGRYGLGSKEFTPAMVKAVYDELAAANPRRRFTVGIMDDVTNLSLAYDESFGIESDDTIRAVFYGLGADGTVGANKNSIKIIGDIEGLFAQGYFVYDSKKSGSMTVSHLRFGPEPIRSPYLINSAQFIACHQAQFLERYDVLAAAEPGAVFLLNTTVPAIRAFASLPREAQETVLEKGLRMYVIDAYKVAREANLGGRINTIMQTCFFAISGVLPREDAIAAIKKAIQDTYGAKGQAIVEQNFKGVDAALAHLVEAVLPESVTAGAFHRHIPMADHAPDFVQRVTRVLLANDGDKLPVSAFPPDGTWPSGTAKFERRNIAQEIPIWEPSLCIQCNKCAFVCPHATIRPKFYKPECLDEQGLPEGFRSTAFKSKDHPNMLYTLQVAPEDCTGCGLCVQVCPVKDKANPKRKAINMANRLEHRVREEANWEFFLDLPDPDPLTLGEEVKATQFRTPLFEFSGACAGCGETPYLKLLTQLLGDRLVIANATGCSSIYGGNLPTTPYTTNKQGRGPAWSNSLFEDNAEYGFGLRLAVDKRMEVARNLLEKLAPQVGESLVQAILTADQKTEAGIFAQRERVTELKLRLTSAVGADAEALLPMADDLVSKSVWIVGGDGWAYDIGYGGLDHILASGKNIKVLVLDTEVYSNTGGQASKSTPLGAVAKFASGGKTTAKKDLGLLAMAYGNVYVASISSGAKDSQTVQALLEAERYPGPALVIAYSPCIAHGYNLAKSHDQSKLAVATNHWPLYRFDPRRGAEGLAALKLDAPAGKSPISQFMDNEARFKMLGLVDPTRARELVQLAQSRADSRGAYYEGLAAVGAPPAAGEAPAPSAN